MKLYDNFISRRARPRLKVLHCRYRSLMRVQARPRHAILDHPTKVIAERIYKRVVHADIRERARENERIDSHFSQKHAQFSSEESRVSALANDMVGGAQPDNLRRNWRHRVPLDTVDRLITVEFAAEIDHIGAMYFLDKDHWNTGSACCINQQPNPPHSLL